MKAWIYKEYGTVEDTVTFVEDFPKPVAKGKDQVLIKVHCCTMNPIDYKIIAGAYKYAPSAIGGPSFNSDMGTVPCCDGAGTVQNNVGSFSAGDHVCFDNGAGCGSLAEYVVVPASQVVRKPDNVSFTEAAASVGLASGTAVTGVKWLLDKMMGGAAGGGEQQQQLTFVVLGGSGGVGTLAVAYLKALGHRVVTTASERNVQWVTEHGADRVINYRKEKWYDVLEPGSVDGVFQCVFTEGDFENAHKVLSSRGAFVSCNSGAGGFLQSVFKTVKRKVVSSFPYTHFLNSPNVANLSATGELVAAGTFPSNVGKIFPFEGAKDALLLSSSGRTVGKSVVQIIPEE